MWYGECKIYNDGSHFIAIPHTERRVKKRPKPLEEQITVIQNQEGSVDMPEPSFCFEETIKPMNLIEITEAAQGKEIKNPVRVRKTTKKELFNELYREFIDLKKKDRKLKIMKEMLPYFENLEKCESFVNDNFERKYRNLVSRRVRMCRKANLADFNYFVTFTYDDAKHNEFSFKKKLKKALENFATRKGWKYMGVWERAPKTNRLHFHGLFTIPEGKMVGELIEKNDYSLKTHKRQITTQNTYFNERFGRCDFDIIEPLDRKLGSALAYLIKYIEKTEEKIVYSKNLYQYFISDILNDDIVCTVGQEDKKLLLFDDFLCLDEGCVMGRVCPEVIGQMRKCNA